MTTAATVVGHLPLVLATGPGAGARNSIGIMLVSGMIIGTVFTLFVVPSIYMLRGADARGGRPRPPARETRVPSWRRRFDGSKSKVQGLKVKGSTDMNRRYLYEQP